MNRDSWPTWAVVLVGFGVPVLVGLVAYGWLPKRQVRDVLGVVRAASQAPVADSGPGYPEWVDEYVDGLLGPP